MPRGNKLRKGRNKPPHNQSQVPPVNPNQPAAPASNSNATPRYYPLMHKTSSIFDRDTIEMGTEKHAGGRPTKYKEEYNTLVYKLCLLGASDKEIAGVLDVDVATFYTWQNEWPELRNAVREGKLIADGEIAHSMYHRAKGYSHTDTHIGLYLGTPVVTETTKHYPPDTAAGKNWLANRRRNNPDPDAVDWTERKEITGEGGKGLFTQDEVDERAKRSRKELLGTLLAEEETA